MYASLQVHIYCVGRCSYIKKELTLQMHAATFKNCFTNNQCFTDQLNRNKKMFYGSEKEEQKKKKND